MSNGKIFLNPALSGMSRPFLGKKQPGFHEQYEQYLSVMEPLFQQLATRRQEQQDHHEQQPAAPEPPASQAETPQPPIHPTPPPPTPPIAPSVPQLQERKIDMPDDHSSERADFLNDYLRLGDLIEVYADQELISSGSFLSADGDVMKWVDACGNLRFSILGDGISVKKI